MMGPNAREASLKKMASKGSKGKKSPGRKEQRLMQA
jgi:hypothetical protein